jgi:hypothetical protein
MKKNPSFRGLGLLGKLLLCKEGKCFSKIAVFAVFFERR